MTIKLGGNRWRLPRLAIDRRLLALLHEEFSDACDGVDVNVQRPRDLVIVITSGLMMLIAHEQNACMKDLLGRRSAVASDRFQTLTGLGRELNNVFS